MGLLAFSYSISLFLFVFSFYLDTKTEEIDTAVTSIALSSGLTTLSIAVAAHATALGNLAISALFFKLCLLSFVFVGRAFLNYAYYIPYETKNTFLNILGWILTAFAAFLIFKTNIRLLSQDEQFIFESSLFYFNTYGFDLYVLIFMLILPGFIFLSLIFRALKIKSRIFKQQLLLTALSLLIGFGISYVLFLLTKNLPWIITLVPFGLAVSVLAVYKTASTSTLIDSTQIVSTLVRFLILGIILSAVIGIVIAFFAQSLFSYKLVALATIPLFVIFLYIKEKIEDQLKKYIRIGSDYEQHLEQSLDAIDFNVGNEQIISTIVKLIEDNIESSTVDILISNDKGSLVTLYSTTNAQNTIATETNALDFLLINNISIVLKTQVITKHSLSEIKPELLAVLDMCQADAFIMLREGHRVIGLIMFGPKKRGGDYNEYDFSVLTNLYTNFFLVVYFLKNIANEAIVMTVDREIEFSGQIISSIQENIDRIQHEKVDLGFITKSARKLGGDFIDFIKLSEDKYLFVMGDISGKGLTASMSMVILKTVIRTFLTETSDFKELLGKINGFIKNNLPKGTFFAGVFGIFDFKVNTLFYVNCGIPVMFLYTEGYNNAIEIQGEGKVLGFVQKIKPLLRVKKIVFNPNDVLLITTDGLIESTNLRGDEYGKEKISRMLLDNRTYPSERLTQFILDDVEDFVTRELEDDITICAIKYLKR